jgi:hypothetical protein
MTRPHLWVASSTRKTPARPMPSALAMPRNECASSRVSVVGRCMCFIAWLILGLIAGWFVTSQGVSSSGAGNFRSAPPQTFGRPYVSHSRPRLPCPTAKRCTRGSVSPEIPESVRRRGRADRRARDRTVPQPPQNRPDIVPPVGKRVAEGMPKHMRTDLQFGAEATTSRTLNHSGEARDRERRATLADASLY